MPEQASHRFVISRLSSLGDVVCSLPAASALKRGFPDAEITWIVDPRFAGIVECCTAVDRVVRAAPKLTTASWPDLEGEYDAAIDLQGLLKSSLMLARLQAKRKVAYHWQREGSWLFAQRVLPDPSSFHIVDQYVDVARAVGGIAHEAEFALKPKDEDLASVRKNLEEKSVRGRFVVMNPGAGWVTKRWPPAHFGRLIDGLAERGIDTVLIGGRASADLEAGAEVERECASAPAILVGATSVRELVALLSLADAHVGGDTGSTHLASALGRPAIGLYSITRPKRSCPYGQVDRCHYDPRGLGEIRPEAVLETLLGAMPPAT